MKSSSHLKPLKTSGVSARWIVPALLRPFKPTFATPPRKDSKTRIKRLRGLRQPEYRLRVDDFRVYYDVAEPEVHILAVVAKHLTYEWLEQHGRPL